MGIFDLIFEIIGIIASLAGAWVLGDKYFLGKRVTEIEIRLIYLRPAGSFAGSHKRILHSPPGAEPKFWDVFDFITAQWIMIRINAWARKNPKSNLVRIPEVKNFLLKCLLPKRVSIFNRIEKHLQSCGQAPDVWLNRASRSQSNPEESGDEIFYDVFIAVENESVERTMFLYVVVDGLAQEVAANPTCLYYCDSPNWDVTSERLDNLTEGCQMVETERSLDRSAQHSRQIWL